MCLLLNVTVNVVISLQLSIHSVMDKSNFFRIKQLEIVNEGFAHHLFRSSRNHFLWVHLHVSLDLFYRECQLHQYAS